MTKAYNGFANVMDATDELDSIRFVIQQTLNGMATAALVLVKAAEGSAGTVDVQPMTHQIDGGGNAVPHGVINAMPYINLRAGGSAIKMTPKPGDIGLAVFCHSDTSSVRNTGAPANPGSRRRFDWADGVYLGGLLGAAPTQFIEMDDDTGITITAAEGQPITLNGDVAVNGKLEASGDIFAQGTSLHTHKHGQVAAGTAETGMPV